MKTQMSVLAVLGLAGAAGASVTQYYGNQIANFGGVASMNSVPNVDYRTHQEGNMIFTIGVNDDFSNYGGCGGDNGLYSNGGGFTPTVIKRDNGSNLGAVEFEFGDGWGQCLNFGYAEAYLGGVLQNSFDIDGSANSTIAGFSGNFDELRVAFFVDANTRNLHDFSQYSAGLIDEVGYGAVPAPGAAAVLGLAGLAAGRRRR